MVGGWPRKQSKPSEVLGMSKESYALGLGHEGLTGFSISLSLWGKQRQMDESDMGVGQANANREGNREAVR